MQVCFVSSTSPNGSASWSLDRGFTVIELMVVISIVAILAALAGPSFTPLIERWRVRDSAEILTSSLYFARSEAIKRGGNVILQTNTGTDWGTGWHIFLDANNDGSQGACVPANAPNECDLQVIGAPTRVDIALPASTGKIAIDRWGMMSHAGSGSNAPTAMAFELKPIGKAISDSSAAKICLSLGGNVKREKGSGAC